MFSVLKYFSESNFGENCEGVFCCRTVLIHYKRHQCNMKNWRVLTVNLNLWIDTHHPLAAICVSFSVSWCGTDPSASEWVSEWMFLFTAKERYSSVLFSRVSKPERHAVSSLSDSAGICSSVAMSTSHLVIITRSPCFVWQPSCICFAAQYKTWEMAGSMLFHSYFTASVMKIQQMHSQQIWLCYCIRCMSVVLSAKDSRKQMLELHTVVDKIISKETCFSFDLYMYIRGISSFSRATCLTDMKQQLVTDRLINTINKNN